MKDNILSLVNMGATLKLIRKMHQLKQVDLAKILGCSQASVSKYEDGILGMSSIELILLCSTLSIPYEVFERCYLDQGSMANKNLRNTKLSTQVPKKYQINCKYNLRSLRPLLQFLYHEYGQTSVMNLVEEKMNLDSTLLFFMDTQLNAEFIRDISKLFKIKKTSFSQALNNKLVGFDTHGDIHRYYLDHKGGLDLIHRYLRKRPYYLDAAEELIQEETKEKIIFETFAHQDDALSELIPDYWANYISGLTKYCHDGDYLVKNLETNANRMLIEVNYAA